MNRNRLCLRVRSTIAISLLFGVSLHFCRYKALLATTFGCSRTRALKASAFQVAVLLWQCASSAPIVDTPSEEEKRPGAQQLRRQKRREEPRHCTQLLIAFNERRHTWGLLHDGLRPRGHSSVRKSVRARIKR